jgi:hypothetical protein
MIIGQSHFSRFIDGSLVNSYNAINHLGGNMKRFVQLITAGIALLFLGTSALLAQEATFSPGPTVASGNGANGGFAWGDVNGDGILDLFTPSTSITISSITTFAPAASTMTQNLPINTNDVGALLADFNGDGVLDLFTTNGGTPATGLYYNTAGVFTAATGTGDLGTAGVTGEVFQGLAAAPIDHSNYLSVAWPGTFANIAGSTGPYPSGGGIWLLKGGASGFTNIGKGATAANLGIDTTLSHESWDVRFFDANNDGYIDLLMPSFRNGFSRVDTGSAGPRKGCVLYLNDGTGKFIIPTSATLPGNPTIYALDSIKMKAVGNVDSIEYASVHADTGIIVDDTVRHFSAIGEQWGDLNNDGIQDLVLNGLGANDNRDGNGNFVNDIILYGNGDGTFTYKWDGVHVVANNGLVQATNQRAIDIGDYNNDGWADIYTSGTFAAQHLYKNNGNGTFTDNAALDGLTSGGQRAGQFVDYNNDGFLDVYMYTGGNSILQKNNTNANHWIGFTPTGSGHNMSAIGARFTVYTATQLSGVTKQNRVIKAEGGSAGMGGELRANFGLGAATAFDSVVVNWPDGTRQSWSYSQLSASGAVTVLGKYWTVVEGSSVPAAPVKVRPSYVASHDTALANYDTLSWSASAAGANGSLTWEVQVGANLAFSTIVKDVTGLTAANTIVRLGYSTKYYWRVREFQYGFTGPWSVADSFSTKYLVDNVVPTKLYPTNNQLGLPLKPTLKVSYVSQASTFQFQVDTLNKFFYRDTVTVAANKTSGLVLNDSTTAVDTFYVFTTNLKPNVKYYWRERGWNAAGSSAFSPVDSFTIMYVPATPVLAYPIGDAPNVPTNLTFKWKRVVPSGQTTPGDSNYIVQFWTYGTTTSGTVVTLMTSDTTKHDSSLVVTGLQNLARYYWKVMTLNQGGASAFTAVDSFTTATAVPGAPTVVSPKSTTGENRIEQFVWNTTPNATSYHMQVSTSSSFATILVDLKLVDTSIVVTQDTLLASTRYYWHVSAVNAGGEGAFSGASTFTTGVVLGVVAATNDIPKVFALNQNYPNPFNPSTTISYDIPRAAYVNVDIYDVLGRRVISLVDGIQAPNHYVMQWNASNVSSGMYFLRIRAHSQDGSDTFNAVKKLLLMK